MSPTQKRYLLSSITTFLSVFLVVLGGSISSGSEISLTWAGIASLITVAGRAGVKAVIESMVGVNADK